MQTLTELADAGVTHAAMEASSHGLDQRRLDGVKLAAAGFTNLGRDHMDYHPTVEDYHAAKMRLFDTLLPKGAPAVILPTTVVAAGDRCGEGKPASTCAPSAARATYLTLKRVEHERHRQTRRIVAGGELYESRHSARRRLPGIQRAGRSRSRHATGRAVRASGAGAAPSGAPGRLELVGTTKDGALGLCRLRPQAGCAGERARLGQPLHDRPRRRRLRLRRRSRSSGKRPIMGEIATRLADVVIVTDDNPRSENAGGDPRRSWQPLPRAPSRSATAHQAIRERRRHAQGRVTRWSSPARGMRKARRRRRHAALLRP
jgi:UDP-N-acetylmuramoyl-L-alanyl-D-glutamate--2,6-diaminopimelate ligase